MRRRPQLNRIGFLEENDERIKNMLCVRCGRYFSMFSYSGALPPQREAGSPMYRALQ